MAKAFNSIPYYRKKFYDPDSVETLKTLNIETVQTAPSDENASSLNSF